MSDEIILTCECGCGEDPGVYVSTRRGHRKGQQRRFVQGHYARVLYRAPVEERFWAKVNVQSPEECWEWQASKSPQGYGHFGAGDGVTKAHRYSYILHNGPIPEGMHVCHRCDNPPCVNPAHLWLGTANDNNADKVAKGRAYRGEAHQFAKLTHDAVRWIRKNSPAMSSAAMARELGLCDETVRQVVKGHTWKHVT